MRKLIVMIIAGCFALPAAAIELTADQRAALLVEAQQAFDHGVSLEADDPAGAKEAFARAANKYGLLADTADAGGELMFNLGNAQLLAGREAEALASFKQAAKLLPGDRRVARHLAYTRALLGGEDHQTGRSAWATVRGGIAQVPIDIQKWTTVAAWNVLWLSLAGAVICQRVRWRWTAAPAAVVCVLAGGMWLTTLWGVGGPPEAVVLRDGVIARSGDGEAFAQKEGVVLDAGTETPVVARRGAWIKVSLPSGGEGWIHERDAALVEG